MICTLRNTCQILSKVLIAELIPVPQLSIDPKWDESPFFRTISVKTASASGLRPVYEELKHAKLQN